MFLTQLTSGGVLVCGSPLGSLPVPTTSTTSLPWRTMSRENADRTVKSKRIVGGKTLTRQNMDLSHAVPASCHTQEQGGEETVVQHRERANGGRGGGCETDRKRGRMVENEEHMTAGWSNSLLVHSGQDGQRAYVSSVCAHARMCVCVFV